MARDRSRALEWGRGRRPVVKNTVGAPNPREGSDGDIQIRNTSLGAKLFGKLGSRWCDTPLSIDGTVRIGSNLSNHLSIDSDSVDVIANGTKVASFGATTTVKDINLTGKIVITSTGTENVCIGVGNNDIGSKNVSIGTDAGSSMESDGIQNVCVGTQAGKDITTGDYNTCIGVGSGQSINTGTYNVCVGLSTGQAIEDGDENICIGRGGGQSITDGLGNIAIGSVSQCQADSGIAIGGLAAVTGDYGIAIGGNISAATNDCVIGKNGTGNYITVDFDADATWDYSSDIRMKRNIQDDTLGLSFIKDLKTKTFQWKPSEEFPEEWENYTLDDNNNKIYPEMHDRVMHGMIAQEVKEALDTAGVDTFNGWSEDEKGIQQLGVAAFVIPLIKAVQELSAEVEELK